MTTTTIPVNGPEPYDVLIGNDIMDSITKLVGRDAKKVLIVHQPTLAALAQTGVDVPSERLHGE